MRDNSDLIYEKALPLLQIGMVVDGLFDPLQLNRVKVMVPGTYNDIPVKDLPWASVATESPLYGGEFVIVFFADGNLRQRPVVIGTFPGITQADQLRNAILEGNLESLTPKERLILEQFPSPDQQVVIRKKGEPSTARISRGVVRGTPVQIANENRAHVCDIRQAMKRRAALARIKFSGIARRIRDAIRAVLKKLGLLPDSESSRFIELALGIVRFIRFIQETIDFIRDVSQALIEYVRYVRAMIDWITQLPQKLAKFLGQCLAEFLSALSDTVSDIFSTSGISSDKGISDAIKAVQLVAESGIELVKSAGELAQVPAQLVSAIASPASQADVDKAGTQITNFFTENFSSKTENTSNKKLP